jgi:U3 small nucleolar ribonucleoprotein protein IMP3
MGFISTKTNLLDVEKKVGISAICRRRLAVVLFRNKYCESVKEAITFIEQSQVRVGTDIIINPGYIVTRSMEDHITWADGSKIKKKVKEYSGILDDYDDNC